MWQGVPLAHGHSYSSHPLTHHQAVTYWAARLGVWTLVRQPHCMQPHPLQQQRRLLLCHLQQQEQEQPGRQHHQHMPGAYLARRLQRHWSQAWRVLQPLQLTVRWQLLLGRMQWMRCGMMSHRRRTWGQRWGQNWTRMGQK